MPYTVRSGDSLWAIAARLLGSGARWRELYQANSGAITDPSRIYPGQVLRLPGEALRYSIPKTKTPTPSPTTTSPLPTAPTGATPFPVEDLTRNEDGTYSLKNPPKSRGILDLDPEQRDAYMQLKATLADYGLTDESLLDWVWDMIVEDASPAQILLELYDRPEFKKAFPEIHRRREAGLAPLSPSEVIEYRSEARARFRAAGLPQGFWDENRDFEELLVQNVSLAELDTRINEGFLRVSQTDPRVRQAFADYFGANGDAALAAVFLDPERAVPVLTRMVTQAEIGGAAAQHGFQLALTRARVLEEIGIGREQAQRGFEKIRELNPLFSETISEQSDFTAEEEGVDSVFGLAGDARERLERRLGERIAAFSGRGDAAITDEGVLGFAVAE